MANSLYGSFEQITTEYIVAGSKLKLGIRDSSEDDLYLADLVNLGVKRLRNLFTLVPAVAQLPIVDFKAKLPEGFVRFNHPIPITFTDEFGKAVTQGVGNPVFVNNAFYTNSPYEFGADQSTRVSGSYNIVNGYIFFSSGTTATHCKIAYLSTNVDEDGEVAIPAIAEDALTAFVCWNYCRTYFQKYSAVANDYKLEWMNGKRHLKAIYNMDDSYTYPYSTRTILNLT